MATIPEVRTPVEYDAPESFTTDETFLPFRLDEYTEFAWATREVERPLYPPTRTAAGYDPEVARDQLLSAARIIESRGHVKWMGNGLNGEVCAANALNLAAGGATCDWSGGLATDGARALRAVIGTHPCDLNNQDGQTATGVATTFRNVARRVAANL